MKFEYPKTLSVNKSLLFLSCNKNHMLEIKIMNGSNLINKFGIYNAVRVIGVNIEVFKFLKNSISSNKFKIIPKL